MTGMASFPWAFVLTPFLHRSNIDYRPLIFILIPLVIFTRLTEDSIISTIQLLNAIVVPYILWKRGSFKSVQMAFKLYLILTLVFALAQNYLPIFREFSALLFGHSSGYSGGKGVPMLSYEPGRSAAEIMIVASTLFVTCSRRKTKIFIFTLIVILLLLNKSFTFFFYLLLFLIFQLKLKNLLVLPIVIIFITFSGLDIRGFDLLTSLINNPGSMYDILMIQGGHRIVGLSSIIHSGIHLGYGFGEWALPVKNYMEGLGSFLENIGFYRLNGLSPVPPMSFLGKYYLETGILGLIFMGLVFKNLINKALKKSKGFTLLMLLYSSLLYYPASPIALMALVYFVIIPNEKNIIHSN
ncbi:hypothetical protein OAM61_01700 [Schleiferiaceae bacterium]|nr:hypothetical protein [Schleiferiaceae bacterium]